MSVSARVASALYRVRLPASALVVAGALLFLPGIDLTHIDNELTTWISRGDPAYRQYENFRAEFGGTRSLIIAVASERLLTPEGLQALDRVSRAVAAVDLVERVHSLTTVNVVRPVRSGAAGHEETLEIARLADRVETPEDAERVRREALDDPLLRGDLISADGRVAGIIVTFDEERIDAVRGAVLEQIRGVVDRELPEGFEAHYNGSLEISEAYNRVTIANTRNLTPPILAITIAVLYWMFRSASRTLLIVMGVGASVSWTLGLYGLTGYSYNILTSMLTPLVVVLAIADDVHIVQHFDLALGRTGSSEEAFKSAVEHLFVPLLGASATTALGMLSLASSDVVAVRSFGIGAAIGVMVDFALSLVFMPTLLTFVRPRTAPPPQERWLMAPLQQVGRAAFTRAPIVLASAGVIAVAAAVGIARLRVDTNHVNFFPRSHPLVRSAEVLDRDLAGIYTFNVLLDGPPGSFTQPDVLARVDRLAHELRQLPHVRKVTSIADYVKRVNQQLEGGDPGMYRLPGTREAIAQELFVFGLSDEGREDLSRVVASDYSRTHMTVKLASMSSDLVFDQIREAEQLAARAFAGSAVETAVTGSGRIFATLDHYLVTSQLSSFATAFVTVFAVILAVFRSLPFGLLGIAANTFPVVAVLGLMGWAGISLNVATVMVASVALGIVDDDTVHFIGRYRREIAAGRSPLASVEAASMHEARAALTTTIVNALSFTVLMASEYRPTAWFGSLLAITMVAAFVTEILLVPAMIGAFPRFFAARAAAHRAARPVPEDIEGAA